MLAKVGLIMTIDINKYSAFIVTGVDVYGKRFKYNFNSSVPSAFYAFNINLHSGSVWGVCKDTEKRKLLKRVCN
jgi:hypothetical protein